MQIVGSNQWVLIALSYVLSSPITHGFSNGVTDRNESRLIMFYLLINIVYVDKYVWKIILKEWPCLTP